MKRRCVLYSIFAGFAPISRAPLVRSRREYHIPNPESDHHLVLMISCFQIPPRERRPESTPLPCNLGTARAPPPYAENAPISRAPLVRSRREDHIPHLESGPRLVWVTSWSPIPCARKPRNLRLCHLGDCGVSCVRHDCMLATFRATDAFRLTRSTLRCPQSARTRYVRRRSPPIDRAICAHKLHSSTLKL